MQGRLEAEKRVSRAWLARAVPVVAGDSRAEEHQDSRKNDQDQRGACVVAKEDSSRALHELGESKDSGVRDTRQDVAMYDRQ